ncbi:unnamed protein product [Clavelina lepadiformis]|uniref:Uncharacterized protein n=1 Tax=Clavelina lepadiformis TaxID=159417 RepID=A0ABP0EUG8_CLALP
MASQLIAKNNQNLKTFSRSSEQSDVKPEKKKRIRPKKKCLRRVIKEIDRRNALDPAEVNRVKKNPLFHKAALTTQLWENDPGAEVRRAHG